MSLIKDIEDAKELWRNASMVFKVFIALSIFLSTSSVASLSERIFEWKGFILDSIEFFRHWISVPISNILKKIGFSIERVEIEMITIIFLLFTSYTRWMWLSSSNGRSRSQLLVSILTSIIFAVVFALLIFFFSKQGINVDFWAFWVNVTIFLTMPIIFKLSNIEKIIYYYPIALAIIITLFLGAVNSGFSK